MAMSASKLKKKDNLDLSKLSARELLLIGESSTFSSQQPCSSLSLKDCSSAGVNSEDEGVNGVMSDDDSDESEEESESEDWEEVDDQHVEAQYQKFGSQGGKTGESSAGNGSSERDTQASQLANIPEGGLEIVIPQEGVFRKGKKQISVADILRRELNKEKLEIQELLHKVSLLCQLARGLQLNQAVNSPLLHDALKERVKSQNFSGKRLDLSKLEKYMKWFRVNMLIYKPSITGHLEETRLHLADDEFLLCQIMEKTAVDPNYNVLIFAAFLRHLNIELRLVISMVPIPIKPPPGELLRKPKDEEESKNLIKDTKKSMAKMKNKKVETNLNKSSSSSRNKKTKDKSSPKSKSSRNKGRKMISSSESEEEEEEKTKHQSTLDPIKVGQDMWVEVYLIEEERWVSVDVLRGKIICDKQLEMEATKPLTYILGFDGKNKVKDVTRRYASEWLTQTQKIRDRSEWWDMTLKRYRGRRTARDTEEDEYLDQHLLSLPMPKSMSEAKNHPLYILRRHLLKYEALYPENPPSVGLIKNEPIYSRDYVHTLHTRELWMRDAKVVRLGETPYKIVKARPKYDKLSGARLPDGPSELFGNWQTEDYIPPIAQNGKVPRNEWGNVELFTEKLLPQGCVHLRLPGLQRVAKKLDIDCAPAVVGFDFGCGGSRPAFDGFVVCEEFKETLLDAWNQDQEEKQRKDEEKRLQRIYGNWRKIIRGLLIRDRLEKKYSVNLSGKRKSGCDNTSDEPSSSKKIKKK